jgi:hypothetical protein
MTFDPHAYLDAAAAALARELLELELPPDPPA